MIFFVNETQKDFKLVLKQTENSLGPQYPALFLTYDGNNDGTKYHAEFKLLTSNGTDDEVTKEMLAGKMLENMLDIPKKHTTKLCPVDNKSVIVYTPGDYGNGIIDTVGCMKKHTPVEYCDARSLIIVITENRPGYTGPNHSFKVPEDGDDCKVGVTAYHSHNWEGFNINKYFIRDAKWQKLQQFNITIGNLPNGDRLELGVVSVVKNEDKSVINALMRYDRDSVRVMDKVKAKKSGHYTASGQKSTKAKKPYNKNGKSNDAAKKPYNKKKPYSGKSAANDKNQRRNCASSNNRIYRGTKQQLARGTDAAKQRPVDKTMYEHPEEKNSTGIGYRASGKPELKSGSLHKMTLTSSGLSVPSKKADGQPSSTKPKKNTSKGMSKLERNKRKFS